MGINWETKKQSDCDKRCEAVLEYKERYGNFDIPVTYVSEDGYRLGGWFRRQKAAYKTTLSSERKKKLDDLGIVFDDSWNEKFKLVEAFYKEHGHTKNRKNILKNVYGWIPGCGTRLNG